MTPDLLALLCCPETHQELRLAEPAMLDQLNRQIAAGALKNRSGQVVLEPFGGGLLRADARVLYPVRQGLPVLLVEEAISC